MTEIARYPEKLKEIKQAISTALTYDDKTYHYHYQKKHHLIFEIFNIKFSKTNLAFNRIFY